MKTRALVLAMLAAVAHPAVAATADEDPGLVVTASRVAETADSSLASVTVITRHEIERSQAQTLLDVLRMQSGIDLSRAGGAGQQTSLFLRGTNSNHTLVLIDGVRATAPTTGAFPWEQMSVAQIERIEIVRGPRSSLWGADAVGGVIQIFTRKPKGLTSRIEGGSFGTKKVQAGWGGGSDRLSGSIHAEYQDIDGFSAQNSNGFGFDPDKDGYRDASVTARLAARLAPNTRLDLKLWHNDGKSEFDQGESDSTNDTANATLAVDVNDLWSQSLSLGFLNDELETRSAFPSQIDNRRYTADWQHDLAIAANHLLTLGLAYYHDEGRNRDTGANVTVYDQQTDNTAGFAMWHGETVAGDLQLSVRHDQHSKYGGHTTEQFAWGMGKEKLRVSASIGTAFRAPNFNELFHPGFFGFFAGNPNLRPERSRSVEASLRAQPWAGHRFRISGFDTQIEDMIAFAGTNAQAININEAQITGAELEYSATLGAWSLTANGTLQVPRDLAAGRDLLRRPKRKLSVASGYRFGNGAHLGGEVLLSSTRLDVDALGNITSLPGYGIVNLNASYPLWRKLVLEGRIENLFDKRYELNSGFNTPSFSVFAALRYQG